MRFTFRRTPPGEVLQREEVSLTHRTGDGWASVGQKLSATFSHVKRKIRQRVAARLAEPSSSSHFVVFSRGQTAHHHTLTLREERAGRMSSCPGKKEFRLGRKRAPPSEWPLSTVFVTQHYSLMPQVLLNLRLH